MSSVVISIAATLIAGLTLVHTVRESKRAANKDRLESLERRHDRLEGKHRVMERALEACERERTSLTRANHQLMQEALDLRRKLEAR